MTEGKFEEFCGILPYFGSPSYLYQRMPMGLNISPTIWQSYINAILSCLQSSVTHMKFRENTGNCLVLGI